MAKAFAKRFYASAKWKHTQEAVMKAYNYTCQRCGRPAKIVHHRVWLNEQNINSPEITLGWDNLEPLCIECHTCEHLQNGGDTAQGLTFDATGHLIKT